VRAAERPPWPGASPEATSPVRSRRRPLGTRRRGTQELTVNPSRVTEALGVTQPPDPRLPDLGQASHRGRVTLRKQEALVSWPSRAPHSPCATDPTPTVPQSQVRPARSLRSRLGWAYLPWHGRGRWPRRRSRPAASTCAGFRDSAQRPAAFERPPHRSATLLDYPEPRRRTAATRKPPPERGARPVPPMRTASHDQIRLAMIHSRSKKKAGQLTRSKSRGRSPSPSRLPANAPADPKSLPQSDWSS